MKSWSPHSGSGSDTADAQALRIWRGLLIPACVLLMQVQVYGGIQIQTPAEIYAEAVDRLQNQDWTGAISRFRTVLELEPEHVPSWFNLASALAESGDLTGAIEAYENVVALDPALFEARMNFAILLQQAGQTREAVRETSEAARLRPGDPVVALFRAELMDQLDEVVDAEVGYRRVIELDPDGVVAHQRLGALFRRTGRTDEAYDALLEAARLGSDDSLVFITLGDIAVERGDLEAGHDHYSRALELRADDEVQLRLALILNESGSYGEAIPLLLELDGVEPILAEAYILNEDFEQAAQLYQTLASEEPDEVDYWLGLGRAYYELQRLEAAIYPLERVVELDPDREQALGVLAAIHHQQSDFERAITVLLRLLDLRPDNALAHFMIGTAYDNLENPREALLHYNEFLELDDGSDDVRSFQVQQRAELLEKALD